MDIDQIGVLVYMGIIVVVGIWYIKKYGISGFFP